MYNMTIKPVYKPPSLDKYSFLSPEAKKALLAVETKYPNMIRNVQKSERKATPGYYESIYNATFKQNEIEDKDARRIANNESNILNPEMENISCLSWDKTSDMTATEGCSRFKMIPKLDASPLIVEINWFDTFNKSSTNGHGTEILNSKWSTNNFVNRNSKIQLYPTTNSTFDYCEQENSNLTSCTHLSVQNHCTNIKLDGKQNKLCIPETLNLLHGATGSFSDSPLLFTSTSQDCESIFEKCYTNTRELKESPTGSKLYGKNETKVDMMDTVDFELSLSDMEVSKKSGLDAPRVEINEEDPLVTDVKRTSRPDKASLVKSDKESPTILATTNLLIYRNASERKKTCNDKCSDANFEHVKMLKRTIDHVVGKQNAIKQGSPVTRKKLKKDKKGTFVKKQEPGKEKEYFNEAAKTKKSKKKEYKPPTKVTVKESIKVNQPDMIKFITLQDHDQEQLLKELETYDSLSLTYTYRGNQALITTFNSLDYLGIKMTETNCLVILPNHQPVYKCFLIELSINSSEAIKKLLLSVLASAKVLKVICNFKEFLVATKKCFEEPEPKQVFVCKNCEDPVIASWILNPDIQPTNFNDICQAAGFNFRHGEWHQCLCESAVIMQKLKEKLILKKLWTVFSTIEMKLTSILANMELSPIHLNLEKFIHYSNILKCKLKKLEDNIYHEAGHKFCLNSHVQLRQVLFDRLKLDLKLPTQSKLGLTCAFHLKSTSESSLNILSEVHPLPSLILEYRQLQKLKSTYIDGIMACAVNGTLASHWSQTAAATGRITSSQPNIQAVPKLPISVTNYQQTYVIGSNIESRAEILAREPYISNPGYVLFAADFQQIELRILAHLSADTGLLATFWQKESQDIFVSLASQWYNKPAEEVSSAERERTKRVVYSIIYGVGKERLSEYLKVQADVARDVMNNFLSRFPALEVFIQNCWSYAREHGYTETICGRKRYFPHINSSSHNLRSQAQRQAINFCVQGSAADICKLAMICVEEKLKQKKHLKCKLLLQIHDELVWEVPENQLMEAKVIIQQVMEETNTLCSGFCSLKVPLPVVLCSGKSWAHLAQLTSEDKVFLSNHPLVSV